jgi:C-terminal processing protease CtpA/Prc
MTKHFSIFAGIFSIFIISISPCDSQSQISEREFLGYWHGPLPVNPKVDVVLYFYKEGENIKGKAFFTEGENLNNEEPIRNVVLSGGKIDFDLPTQSTHYSGKISLSEIKGGFDTPGNPLMKFSFTKAELEKLASVDAIKRANKPFDLNQTFTLNQLKEDFSILKEALRSHPQVYLYYSKDEVDDYFNNSENKLYEGMKAIDLIRFVAPIIAHLKCYHSQLVLPEKIRSAVVTEFKSIPLDITYLDERAYVRRSLVDNPEIEPGSEILEINGRSAKDILQRLALCISADGNNMSHKIEEINNKFGMLYHYIDNPDNYTLKIRRPSTNEITHITISAIATEKVLKALALHQPAAKETDPNPVPVALSVTDHTGILTVKSFMYPDLGKYKGKLAAYFDEINDKEVKYLIVDLRGNAGGHPVLAADLFSYFIHESAAYLKEPSNDQHYSELTNPVKPRDNGYNGRAYFLSDGDCQSSTGHLLTLIKYHKLGGIVGDIPGGSFSCSDDSKLWELPNSKIQFTVAQTTFTAAVEGWEKGDQVIPDFLVKPTVADIIAHNDTTMEYVQNLIRSKL